MSERHYTRRYDKRSYLPVDIRRLCVKCGQRKPIDKGCRTKPSFVCAECSK